MPAWGRIALNAALLTGCAILVTLPIYVLNCRAGDPGTWVTASGGLVFYSGNNHAADGLGYTPPPLLTAEEERRFREDREVYPHEHRIAREIASAAAGETLTPSAASAFWMAQGRQQIRKNPAGAVKRFFRKIFYFWNAYDYHDTPAALIYASRYAIPALEFGTLTALAFAGLYLIRPLQQGIGILWGVVALFFASELMFYVSDRLRLPAYPFLLILGVYGGEALRRAFFIRTRRARLGIFLFGILLAVTHLSDTVIEERKKTLDRAAVLQFEGETMLKMGNRDAAEARFREARRLDSPPNGPPPSLTLDQIRKLRDRKLLNRIGAQAMAEKDFPKAEAAFQQGVEISPDDPVQHYNLSLYCKATGQEPRQIDQIIEALECGIEFYPLGYRAYLDLASIALAHNQREEAARWLASAQRFAPDASDTLTLKKRLEEAK